ncbi:MAG: response regulator transcription factor [Lachnospiraceae bacterium]|nr:response regulator transcription factor [Lachnospiraceae bacterium]
MGAKILIVEDDNYINNMIKDALEIAGYDCLQAFSGTEGLLLLKESPELVILDLMLPGKNGEEVIKQIKSDSDIPVIVVSAKDSVDSKIELLRLGADDYLTKPFDIKELEVRVEVRIRRYRESHQGDASSVKGNAGKSGEIVFKELRMNPESFTVKVNDTPVELTKHEFRILELLVKNPARAFTKQNIYEYVWDDSYLGEDKTINVHISNIRKKLKAVTAVDYIETVWGIGFKLNTK